MHSSVEDAAFKINHRNEIIFIFQDFVRHQAAINLFTSDGVGLQTAVLDISAGGDFVYLDISQDDVVNEQIIKSKYVDFFKPVGVRVRWRSAQVKLVALPDGDAFSIIVPEVLERIQRREYFRLSVPQGEHGLICNIPSALLAAPMVNMSVGGCSLSIKGDLPSVFSKGSVLQRCSVEFPDTGAIPLTLKVSEILAVTTKSGDKIHHIGMEFVNLSRGANAVIQRQMFHLESEGISHIA